MKTEWTETLPDTLPGNPMQMVAEWLTQARADAAQPNPNAMVLATVDAAGQPSARVVLCKDIGVEAGFITFYTNYESRKGRELKGNPSAAIVFHWDHRHRQVRAEGRVERLSDAENDAYFADRPWRSQLGAWASHQSEPVASGGRRISDPRPRPLDARVRLRIADLGLLASATLTTRRPPSGPAKPGFIAKQLLQAHNQFGGVSPPINRNDIGTRVRRGHPVRLARDDHGN
jgi:general stress protein 26